MDALVLSVAAVLLGLAVLHAYWAAGGAWPGKTPGELAQLVVGGPTGLRMPSSGACMAVAVALAAAAALVPGAHGTLELPLAGMLVRIGALVVAAVLTLRGLLGFVEVRLRPVIAGTPYARLNVVAYSPLALALGLGTFAAVL